MEAPIEERFTDVAGIRLCLRERRGAGIPTIYLHGNPGDSRDWIPFMAADTGLAIALDLPGFGRSERPRPDRFDYSVGSYGQLLEAAFAELAPDGYRLVVHDWGVVGLLAAQAQPAAVRRLVVINAVPFSAAYRWHWIARCWRRRGLGEALARPRPRWLTERLLRSARAGRDPFPADFVDRMFENWDAGMARAILRLYRSADRGVLAAAGERLGMIECPALVLWGDSDPYIAAADGRSFERQLPGARFVLVERAGHWPWIDRPDVVDQVTAFLAGDTGIAMP